MDENLKQIGSKEEGIKLQNFVMIKNWANNLVHKCTNEILDGYYSKTLKNVSVHLFSKFYELL